MKKMMFLVLMLTIFLVGCGKKEDENNYEKLMLDNAKIYYEESGRKIFFDTTGQRVNQNMVNFVVYLSNLKNANKYGGNFDLTGLETCADETMISFELDQETLEIKTHEFVNKCK
jgi:hypothetical protein